MFLKSYPSFSHLPTKWPTFRGLHPQMQNSCCCLRSLTANALKTSEMSCQCLNMAPTARVAGASATPQQRLVALATRALAT